MRIAMLTNNYKPFIGGVPISIERLSESLRALGHEVYIFAPTYKNQVEEEGVIRYRSYKKTLENGGVIPNVIDPVIEASIKKLKIDVIHVHHPNFIGWMAQYLGKKYSIPVVYTYHTRYEQYLHHIKPLNQLEQMAKKENMIVQPIACKLVDIIRNQIVPSTIKRYANKCEGIFAPTMLMKEILEEEGIHTLIQVLPTGIGNNFFKEEVEKSKVIRKQYIGDKKYLLCTVSRLNKEKNIAFLIEGLKQLKEEVGDNFKTLIIGDGPLKSILEEQVKVLGLANNIIFLSSIPNSEIKHYYSACDLFLFSSKSETQGIVLLEAMASKIPVVAVRASGVVEVVRNNINGYMTEEDTGKWAQKIALVLKDSIIRKRLKNGAYETAQRYTNYQVASLAEKYYKQIILEYYHTYDSYKREVRYETKQIYFN